jgi:flagellar hook-length control protein FliK
LTFATPIDAPDFAATLGVQVSVLAQDGVQHAELHLNPAEMGPVSIHIALEGSAARVDFGADVAATREAIERGLPELASALRDAGFTLAGGGVSSHAGPRSNGGDEAADAPGSRARIGSPSGAAAAAPAAISRAVRHVAAGGIDLYA